MTHTLPADGKINVLGAKLLLEASSPPRLIRLCVHFPASSPQACFDTFPWFRPRAMVAGKASWVSDTAVPSPQSSRASDAQLGGSCRAWPCALQALPQPVPSQFPTVPAAEDTNNPQNRSSFLRSYRHHLLQGPYIPEALASGQALTVGFLPPLPLPTAFSDSEEGTHLRGGQERSAGPGRG